jgi:hypothetical protein
MKYNGKIQATDTRETTPPQESLGASIYQANTTASNVQRQQFHEFVSFLRRLLSPTMLTADDGFNHSTFNHSLQACQQQTFLPLPSRRVFASLPLSQPLHPTTINRNRKMTSNINIKVSHILSSQLPAIGFMRSKKIFFLSFFPFCTSPTLPSSNQV